MAFTGNPACPYPWGQAEQPSQAQTSGRSPWTNISLGKAESFAFSWRKREAAAIAGLALPGRGNTPLQLISGAGDCGPASLAAPVTSAAVAGEAMGRMARVAAAILPAHIGDGRVGMLALHLERRDYRVLRVDRDAVGLALGDEADGVMGWRRFPP